jgi:type VI protein secretion system component Hcp
MKMRTPVLLLGVLGGLAVAGPASAAENIFLSLTGITGGELVQPNYKGQIDILAFSQTVARTSDGSKPTCGVINVQKLLDQASAPLVASVLAGNVIQTGVLSVVVPNGAATTQIYKITLQGVVVTSVSQSASAAGGLPVESVTLQAQKVQLSVDTPSPTGGTGTVTVASINCMTDTAQ